ncbi:MAG: type II toxin-antitoxin system VapC family toxin [Methylococcales bacterium]|jgi:predicted nucleic acid-binding protein
MNSEVFLDTAYAIALSSEKDEYHERAIDLAGKLEQASTRLITTRAVQLEIGNALSKQRYRHAAVQLLDSLEADPTVEIITLSETLYAQAFQLYRERRDKEWGLVDCTSFVVMKERNITEALTTDEHYQQAGFRVLLRETKV